MRNVFLFCLLFISALSFSQVDTTASKNGLSLFAGLGTGGNTIKQGFARGFSIRYHFKANTIDGYVAHTTQSEAGYTPGHDLTTTYDAFNCGLSYGLGLYERNFSYSALVGIGYTNADVTIIDATSPQIFVTKTYVRTCGVLGLQAGLRLGFVGLGVKFYYNIFNGPSNYSLLAGLELTLH